MSPCLRATARPPMENSLSLREQNIVDSSTERLASSATHTIDSKQIALIHVDSWGLIHLDSRGLDRMLVLNSAVHDYFEMLQS